MRFSDILTQHLLDSVAKYKAGEYTKDEIRALTLRIARLRGVSRKLEASKQMDAQHAHETTKNFRRARRLVREARMIVAMDTGRSFYNARLEDLGVATWREGEWSTSLYVVDWAQAKRAQVMDRSREDTEVHVLSEAEVRNVAQHYFDAADVCVFHGAHSDLPSLELDTSSHRYLDTALLAERWFYDGHPSLGQLCKRYSISTHRLHHSANDAYFTLRALLAMVDDDREGCRRFRKPQFLNLDTKTGKN